MENLPVTEQEILEFRDVYSPATLLGAYASAIRSSADGRIILAKGSFQASGGQALYGGYYYDTLKSLADNKNIKLKVPALLRSRLENNSIYLFKGYIEKKIGFSSIELLLVVDEVLQKEDRQVSEEDLQRFGLIQQKISQGFRDLEAAVRDHIYRADADGEPFRIINIYGNTAIVHKDFEKGIADASSRFEIMEHRCNFASRADIIRTLGMLNGYGADAIALVRGGGDAASLDVFNDPELGAALLKLDPIVITALGHTVNETLADKLADRKFALPHDYGNSLKVWVDAAIEDREHSKSAFIDQVKNDLSKTFHAQITTLQTQLETRNREFSEAQQKFREIADQSAAERNEAIRTLRESYEANGRHQVAAAVAGLRTQYELSEQQNRQLSKEVKSLSKKSDYLWLYVLGAAVVGALLGMVLG